MRERGQAPLHPQSMTAIDAKHVYPATPTTACYVVLQKHCQQTRKAISGSSSALHMTVFWDVMTLSGLWQLTQHVQSYVPSVGLPDQNAIESILC